MSRILRLVVGVLLLAAPLLAQTPPPATPANVFLWDQVATDAATAQAYTYRYYPDAVATGTTFATPVTCTGGPPPMTITCRVAVPAFTPGSHSIALTAGNVAGESAKSTAFAFTFVIVPGIPGNIRIGTAATSTAAPAAPR